jgi:hypothetical protein
MSAMGNAIQITIAPPRSHAASRIYINSTAVSVLNTTANVTLYYLPFDTVPNITYDGGGDNGVTVVENTTWYDAGNKTMFLNLTLEIANFSGYNLTDEVVPKITFYTVKNATNYSVANINFSVNGTGSDVKYIYASLINSTGTTLYDWIYSYNGTNVLTNTLNCSNITGTGSRETANCTLQNITLPAITGNYSLYITAYDWGGLSATGNVKTANSSFMNNSAPTIVTAIAYTNQSIGHVVTVLATFTDPNGYQDMDSANISITNTNSSEIACTYNRNTTDNIGILTVYYNCTNKTAYNPDSVFNLTITINDSYNNTVNSSISAEFALPDHAPVISAVTLSPLPITNSSNITCTPTVSDVDNDTFNYTYNWSLNDSYHLNVSGWDYNTTSIMPYLNLSTGTNVSCLVKVNTTYANATAVNSTTYTVQRADNYTLDVNTTNATVVNTTINYTSASGNITLQMVVANDTNITVPETYDPGNVFITNFTAASGDLTSTNASAFNLSFSLGPGGTNFSPNITVTINYSELSTAAQAQIATALANGNLTIKKCNDSGGACQSLKPSAYSTTLKLINVSISGFSTLGLYDSTPAPSSSSSTTTTSSGGSTGGGSFSSIKTATTTCTPNWNCGNWGVCQVGGTQTRVCSDSNSCGATSGKPDESRTCTYTKPSATTPTSGGIGGATGAKETINQENAWQQKNRQTTTAAGQATAPTGIKTPTKVAQSTDLVGTLVALVVIIALIVVVGAAAFYFLKSGKGNKKGLKGL